MSNALHITVRNIRSTSEVFTSTTLDNADRLQEIVALLTAKGFKVETDRYVETDCVWLRVKDLRSDKAIAYAKDLVVRAGRKVGFAFLNTQYL
jgi:hypothetical protein